MTITQAWAGEITKFEKTDDGHLMVYGKATGPDLDLDGQVCDPKWLRKAMPEWMAWGNVREMHRPSAAGVGKELSESGDDWNLKALVVDRGAIEKVETRVYKGYSVGISKPQVIKDRDAPGGRVVGGVIVEVSLVDRPCNPTATMGIAKAHGGVLAPVEMAGEVVGKAADPDGGDEPLVDDGDDVETPEAPDPDDELAVDAAAKAAKPTADDDLPIFRDVAARPRVENALEVAKSYLAGQGTLTPSAYRKAVADVDAVLTGTLVKRKADEAVDIAGAQDVIARLAALIISEATELAAGRMDEAGDIECLMSAVRAVKNFLWCETRQDGTDVPGDDAQAMAYVGMAAKADPGASIGGVQAAKAATPDGAAAPESPDITKMIDEAVAKAGQASDGRIKALEAELAKVMATPVPGGPYLMPAAPAPKAAAPADDRARFALMAERASDPAVAHAYRMAAAASDAK